ncbi:hypothetical protein [Burkholderia sp. BCC1977]|uniref:hypothetical protein n=1 Tax=Burkholderia sp. BCC1977 TaxID=2817440 RepID=UPI002ABE3E84|nr:hypothetical protein [Burkholderia sp. BCC1977]
MKEIELGLWIPYLNNSGVRMGFVLVMVGFISRVVLKLKRPNEKLAFRVTNVFLVLSAIVVIASAVTSYLSAANPYSMSTSRSARVGIADNTAAVQEATSSRGAVQMNSASIAAVPNAVNQALAGISMSGAQSNNLQIVGGSNNIVTNRSGKEK